MMTLDMENRPILISEHRRNFQNLFFASISLIFGNSITISFLVNKPNSVLNRRNIKRQRILNDQVFLGFNFIYVFGKIGFLLGVFSFLTFGFQYVESLVIPALLLIIVLYLESWKTLVQVIKKNRFKIQILHLIVFLILTIVLSKVNVFDYKTFDETMLIKNPSIDVPESFFKEKRRSYFYDDIIFKMDFISKEEIGLFTVGNKRIELNQINDFINEYYSWIPEYDRLRLKPTLRANKNIPIRKIKEFELELFKSGFSVIIYEVSNDDKSTSKFYNNQLQKTIVPISSEDLNETKPMYPLPPTVWDFIENNEELKFLRLNISEVVTSNGVEIKISSLGEKLKKYINQSTIIEYVYFENTTLQDYINVLSAHKTAVWEIRSTEDFDKIDSLIRQNRFSRDKKLYDERNRLIRKYPFRATERFE